MEQHALNLDAQIEAIGRYLGRTFPASGIARYRDSSREVVGFRFIGAAHGNVEFEHALLATFPSDENGIALELHLLHAGSAITETPPDHCLLFTRSGPSRSPAHA